jgi:hypothetical protein
MPYKIKYSSVKGSRVGMVYYQDSKPKHSAAYLQRHHIIVTEVKKKGKDKVFRNRSK